MSVRKVRKDGLISLMSTVSSKTIKSYAIGYDSKILEIKPFQKIDLRCLLNPRTCM